MKALILAGGKGKRLGSLTKNLPKPMVLMKGKPVLEHLILLLKKHQVKEIFIALSHLPDKIINYFGDGKKWGVKINFSIEKKPLGTSGALTNFEKYLNEPFFVIYGDNLTNLNLSKMSKKHKKSKALGTIYLYRETMMDKKTTPGKVILDGNFFVKKIIENPDSKQKKLLKQTPSRLKFTNSGIYILNPEILSLIPKEIPSDFAKDIFPKMLNKKLKIGGYLEDCYIREIGQMQRYLLAKKEVDSGKIKLNYLQNE